MTPQQALSILEEATNKLLLTRSDHLIVAQAIETIKLTLLDKQEQKIS